MLTDRQNKFFDRIATLTVPGAAASRQEQSYLSEAKAKILDGWDFKWSINKMNLDLKKLSESVPLSPRVQKLYDDLIVIYGEPTRELQGTESIHHPKDWRDSDPDLVYTGSGRVSGWTRRSSKATKQSFKINFIRSLFSQLIFWGGLLLIILLFTPLFSGLRKELGIIGFRVIVGILIVIFFVWLVKDGSLKGKK